MTLKIAVFAPIPSPSVISAASVNPGVRARRRSAYFKSRIESIIGPFLPLIPRSAPSSARSRMQRILLFWLFGNSRGSSRHNVWIAKSDTRSRDLPSEFPKRRCFQDFICDEIAFGRLTIDLYAKTPADERKKGSGANLIIMENIRHDPTLFREARTLQRPSFQPSSYHSGCAMVCHLKAELSRRVRSDGGARCHSRT